MDIKEVKEGKKQYLLITSRHSACLARLPEWGDTVALRRPRALAVT